MWLVVAMTTDDVVVGGWYPQECALLVPVVDVLHSSLSKVAIGLSYLTLKN